MVYLTKTGICNIFIVMETWHKKWVLKRLSEEDKTMAWIADQLGVSRQCISQLLSREDIYLSTLKKVIEVLDGELKIGRQKHVRIPRVNAKKLKEMSNSQHS